MGRHCSAVCSPWRAAAAALLWITASDTYSEKQSLSNCRTEVKLWFDKVTHPRCNTASCNASHLLYMTASPVPLLSGCDKQKRLTGTTTAAHASRAAVWSIPVLLSVPDMGSLHVQNMLCSGSFDSLHDTLWP